MLDRTAASVRRCVVVPSTVADVYALAAALRPDDRAEVESLGVTARAGIRRSFRNAILRKTYFVDGEIAAMSGLCGTMIGDIGEPYLMTTPAAERMPVMFIKQAKAAVAEMLHHKLRLEGYVDARYERECRMLKMIGFSLGEPQPIAPTGALFRQYSMMRGA